MPRWFRSIPCLMSLGLAACGAQSGEHAAPWADSEEPLYGSHTQALLARAADGIVPSSELDEAGDDGATEDSDVAVAATFYKLSCGSTIIAKPSRGRGAGTPPNQCGAGREYDAGLCYQTC